MNHHKKHKTYLFECKENYKAYRLLDTRDWKNGDIIKLPSIRVKGTKSYMADRCYVIYLYKIPIIYGGAGYVHSRTWKIKQTAPNVWKLKPIKFNKL